MLPFSRHHATGLLYTLCSSSGMTYNMQGRPGSCPVASSCAFSLGFQGISATRETWFKQPVADRTDSTRGLLSFTVRNQFSAAQVSSQLFTRTQMVVPTTSINQCHLRPVRLGFISRLLPDLVHVVQEFDCVKGWLHAPGKLPMPLAKCAN